MHLRDRGRVLGQPLRAVDTLEMTMLRGDKTRLAAADIVL